jgi:hypothetical protein
MPKVGDRLTLSIGYKNRCVQDEVHGLRYVNGDWEVLTDGEWKCLYGGKPISWNWQDPAVEAKRLMEAAYRADTSPFPEWLTETIEDIETSKHGHPAAAIEIADYQMWMLGAGSSNPDKAREALSRFTHLLRWQAQQEGGKP